MAVDIGARIKVDGEAAYNKQIAQIIKQQKELKADMDAVSASFAKDASQKEKSAAKTKQLERQLTTANEKLRLQKDELSKLEAAGQGASAKADNLRLSIARTEAEVAKLNKELRENSGMVAFGKDLQAAGDKMESIGGKMTKFGSTMTRGITVPLAAAGAAAVKLATQFETAMAKLNSIADTSEVSLDDLRKQILALSNDTGVAASELAEQTYQAISAGQDTADSVRFVAQTTKLAKAGFAETGNALDVLTTILNAYGKSSAEAASVSDKLIATQNLGKTTVAQLSENMGQAIPTAAAYAVDLDNISAAYVTLTKQGINTANATTQINGLMNQLGKSGTTAAKVLKEKTGKNFKELMQSGHSLADVLKIVAEAAEEQGMSLNDMFGNVRAGRAAMAIMNDEGVTFSETMEKMASAAGATEEAFAKVSNTTAYQFEVSLNKVKNTGIEAGQQLLITLAPAIEKVGKAIMDALDHFNSLTKSEQQAIIKTAMFAAGIGPAVTALGGLTTGLGSATKGAGALIEKWALLGKVPTSGIVGIAVAFVGISAALAKLSNDAEKYSGEIGKVNRESKKVAESGKDMLNTLEDSAKAYSDNSRQMADNSKQANTLVDRLDELSKKGKRTSAENREMAAAVENLNRLYPGLNLSIDESTGRLSQNTTQLRENVKSLQEQTAAMAAQERMVEIQKQIMDIQAERARQEEQLATAEENLAKARENYNKSMEAGLTNGEAVYTQAATSVKELSDNIGELNTKEKELKNELSAANAYLDRHGSSLEQNTKAAEQGVNVTDEMAEALEEEAAAAEEAAEKIAEGAKLQVKAFDEVEKAQTKSIQDIIKGLQSQVDAQRNYRTNIQKLQEYVKKDSKNNWGEIVRIFSEGGIEMAGELQGVVDAIEKGDTDALNALAELANGVQIETSSTGQALVQFSGTAQGAIRRTAEVIKAEAPTIRSAAKQAAQGSGTGYREGMNSAAAIMYTDSAAGIKKAAQGINDGKEPLNKAAKGAAQGSGDSFKAGVANSDPRSAGYSIPDRARMGVDAARPGLIKAAAYAGSSGGQAAVDSMRSKRAEAERAGQYITEGLAKGIRDKQRAAEEAATAVTSSALRNMNRTAMVASPSKATIETGQYIAEGLVVGMMNQLMAVRSAAAAIASAALPSFGATYDIGNDNITAEEMYSAVRDGASNSKQEIILNGRELTRGLKSMGVVFSG